MAEVSGKTKQQLEKEKLQAEVAAIHSRTRQEEGFLPELRTWVGLLTAAVALVAGGWGIFEVISNYLDQRDRRLEFEVNEEIIKLAAQVYSGNDKEAAYAALLLSYFEEHSVPVLVAKIDDEDSGDLLPHISTALELIATKERVRADPELLLDPLLQRARSAARKLESDPSRTTIPLTQFIEVIGEVMEDVEDRYAQCKAISFLKELLCELESGLEPLEEFRKLHVRQKIDQALERLEGKPCSWQEEVPLLR